MRLCRILNTKQLYVAVRKYGHSKLCWCGKCFFHVFASVSDLFPSDLVNGLVLLMNSNISSPVNLVSSSFVAFLWFSQIKYLLKYKRKTYQSVSLSIVALMWWAFFKMCLQGNPEEHTILEFARLIKSLVGMVFFICANVQSDLHTLGACWAQLGWLPSSWCFLLCLTYCLFFEWSWTFVQWCQELKPFTQVMTKFSLDMGLIHHYI